MEIKATIANGKISLSPDVAHVRLGEHVSWVCSAVASRMQKWTVNFRQKSPFKTANTFSATSPQPSTGSAGRAMAYLAQYQVAIAAGVTVTPGDYKYDVELSENGKPLYEIDPTIIVR